MLISVKAFRASENFFEASEKVFARFKNFFAAFNGRFCDEAPKKEFDDAKVAGFLLPCKGVAGRGRFGHVEKFRYLCPMTTLQIVAVAVAAFALGLTAGLCLGVFRMNRRLLRHGINPRQLV